MASLLPGRLCSGYAANWHPLTWLSHIADCELYGLRPAGHHITNLLLHVLNTLLLFWVFRKMTGSVWPSAFVAAVFALHPLHVESVAWVAERKDVLSTLFWLGTMIAYVRYAERCGTGNYLLVVLMFGLGLMAKPMLVTLPCVLLLLDYWPLKRFDKFSIKWLIVEKIPLFVLAAGSSIITFFVQQKGGAVIQLEFVSVSSRLGNALVSYIGYIGKMIYPSGLAVLYPYPAEGVGSWRPLVAVALLAGLTLFFIRLAGKQRYALVGWLWYLVTLVPVLGMVQVGSQAMADRYTYIPSIGIFVVVAWGLSDLLNRWKNKRVILSISALITILLATLATRIQVGHWRNSIALYEHTLNVTEHNFIIHGNYGKVLDEDGRTEEAIEQYQNVLEIRPDRADAHYSLGVLFWETVKQPQSIAHYQKAVQLEPDMTKAIYNLATALMKISRYDEAAGHFRKVLELRPDHAVAHFNLGVVLDKLGKGQQSINHFKLALKLNPDNPDAHYNLGVILGKMGKLEQTIEHFDNTLQLNPENVEAHNKLAKVYHELKKPGKAMAHLTQSLALQPQQPGMLNMLAWLKAAYQQADSMILQGPFAWPGTVVNLPGLRILTIWTPWAWRTPLRANSARP